jgi:hypothetical protein
MVSRSDCVLALKIEAMGSSETSGSHRDTRCHNSEESTLHSQWHENLKSKENSLSDRISVPLCSEEYSAC